MDIKEKDKLKLGIIISTYIILLVFLLFNFNSVKHGFSYVFGIISPFFVAIAIAFVLNIPMKFFEEKVFKRFDTYKKGKFKSVKRPLSLITTFICIIGAVVLIAIFIVPQLKESITTLISSIPDSLKSIEDMVAGSSLNSKDLLGSIIDKIINMWKDIAIVAGKVTSSVLSQVINITISVTSVVANFFIALVLSVYMLISKEKLILNAKKFMYAFFKRDKVDSCIKVLHVVDEKFSKFIQGQCTEAVIIGVLVFIAMSIFRMPYAGLISVIVGVTALIPIFGAIIGTVPGVFILFTVSPATSFWFIVLIIVVQQLEGNLIYPKVVGGTIGLSGIWVMMATVIGGNLFGVLGILIGIPLVSVMYTLISEIVNNKIKDKKIDIK